MQEVEKKGTAKHTINRTLLIILQCDQQKPTCGRCLRLGIPCVGSGVQRYKFQDTSAILVATRGRSATRLTVDAKLSRSPSNALSKMASCLVSALEVSDMRYSVSHYLGFLAIVPQRLGRNEVLDNAVRAVLADRLFTQDSKRQRCSTPLAKP
jgi:hypothetical protein